MKLSEEYNVLYKKLSYYLRDENKHELFEPRDYMYNSGKHALLTVLLPKIEELEKQIEKMKSCGNCEYNLLIFDEDGPYFSCDMNKSDCRKCNKWELKNECKM